MIMVYVAFGILQPKVVLFLPSLLLRCRSSFLVDMVLFSVRVEGKNAGDTEMSRVSILLESSQPRKLQKKVR
jgi:hypothetical protein